MKFLHDGDFSNDDVIWSLLVYSAPLRLAIVVDVMCSDWKIFLMLTIVVTTCRIVSNLNAWFCLLVAVLVGLLLVDFLAGK